MLKPNQDFGFKSLPNRCMYTLKLKLTKAGIYTFLTSYKTVPQHIDIFETPLCNLWNIKPSMSMPIFHHPHWKLCFDYMLYTKPNNTLDWLIIIIELGINKADTHSWHFILQDSCILLTWTASKKDKKWSQNTNLFSNPVNNWYYCKKAVILNQVIS